MNGAWRDSERQQSRGTFLLSLGLLFLSLLVLSGVHALTFDQPDMIHLNHALMTAIGGPVAVTLIVCGIVARRRRSD
jgi:hypothetical protein